MGHADLDRPAVAAGLLRAKPVLVDKLVAACDLDPAQAPRAVLEVLRFLSLVAEADQSLTPSPRVDDAWHEMILCTREYADLCAQYFGRFMHHDPGGGDALNRARFRETIRRYTLRFGTPDPAWWGAPSPLSATADCGPCQGPP
ncbi:MAG: hypothetical protein AAGF11_08755 [Myxococcota bacterium]